jgi:hypothetical protein
MNSDSNGYRGAKEKGGPVELRTKSIEQSIEDTDEPGTRLRKDLTWSGRHLHDRGDLDQVPGLDGPGGATVAKMRFGMRTRSDRQ